MANVIFCDKFLKNQNDGTFQVDFNTDKIRVKLITTNFSATSLGSISSVTELATGDGYTTGGEVLSSASGSLDTTNHRYDIDFGDKQWTFTAAKTFRYAGFFQSAATEAASPLIAKADLGSQTITGIFNLNLADAFLFRFRASQ
jgi:hypothetical protein